MRVFSGMRMRDVPIASLAAALLLSSTAGMALFGYSRTERRLRRPSFGTTGARQDGARASEIARIVQAVARRLPGRYTCLARALALRALLHRHGLEGALQIGVRIEQEQLVAHAWVEHAGVPLREDADLLDRYTPLLDAAAAQLKATWR